MTFTADNLPEAETTARDRIRLAPPNAHIEFTTEPMTRAEAISSKAA